MEIYCFIYKFVCSPTKNAHEDYILTGKNVAQILDILIISIQVL